MAGYAYFVAAQVLAFAVQGIVYCIVAFLVDWRLALLGMAVGFAIAAPLQWLVTISKRAGYKRSGRTSALTMLRHRPDEQHQAAEDDGSLRQARR